MKREHWKSKLGFTFAAMGSAVGLGNIWRFPYIMGQNGGASFIVVYLICLLIIGFPILVAEIGLGRAAESSPSRAYKRFGGKGWGWIGKMSILTGFLIASFYSVIAGWIFGYFLEALKGGLSHFSSSGAASTFFLTHVSSPFWAISNHALFMFASVFILYTGVRNGIERWNKVLMPLLIGLLLLLVGNGLAMPTGGETLSYLFSPKIIAMAPAAIMMALGQAFFSLSLGQGTMITYGSYLPKKGNIPKTSFPIAAADTAVSLLAGIAVFSVVFAAGFHSDEGPSLLFTTLPTVFSHVSLGWLLAPLFFLLILLAALTSEISALEPTIAYIMEEWGWSRKKAVCVTAMSAFLIGIPAALSNDVVQNFTLFGRNFFDLLTFITLSVLVPLGGLALAIYVGWVWGFDKAYASFMGSDKEVNKNFVYRYFKVMLCYLAPLAILLVFFNLLGIF